MLIYEVATEQQAVDLLAEIDRMAFVWWESLGYNSTVKMGKKSLICKRKKAGTMMKENSMMSQHTETWSGITQSPSSTWYLSSLDNTPSFGVGTSDIVGFTFTEKQRPGSWIVDED